MTGTVEEMASELQRKFEALVTDDNDVYEKACKGMLCYSFLFHVATYICRICFFFFEKNCLHV